MEPLQHAESSARIWGGTYEDYLDLHEWMDASKAAHSDMRHRALTHHSWGCELATQVFGRIREVRQADGTVRRVSVRHVLEEHVKEDMGGFLPSISYYLDLIPPSELPKFARRRGQNYRATRSRGDFSA